MCLKQTVEIKMFYEKWKGQKFLKCTDTQYTLKWNMHHGYGLWWFLLYLSLVQEWKLKREFNKVKHIILI